MCWPPKHLQVATARIGVDLGIFDAIHESKEPLSISTLADKTGASSELIGTEISQSESRNSSWIY